ncbi:MAG: hypothetical protein FWD39_05240 [Clostridiales bacterium]|nr:hypothetical protein [Clostridiales bacterium]
MKIISTVKPGRMPRLNPRRLLYLFIILLAAGLVYVIFNGGRAAAADYDKLLADALNRTFSAESYRFFSKSTLHIDQENRTFSLLEGEKSGPQNRHVKGNMLGTPVDVYALGQNVYRQDPVSGAWKTLSPSEVPDALALVDEMSPAVNFKFSETGEVKFLGKEKLEGKTYTKLQFRPVLEDKWLERYFHDITYTVWLSGKKPNIAKTVITGKSKESAAVSLTIEIRLTEFGKNIKIIPPVI